MPKYSLSMFTNTIPTLSDIERMGITDWFVNNTTLNISQISSITRLDNAIVKKIFNSDYLNFKYLSINPISEGYITQKELDFWQKHWKFNYDTIEQIQNTSIKDILYANLIPNLQSNTSSKFDLNRTDFSDLIDCKIYAVFVSVLYFLIRGHSAWYSTWSSRFDWNGSLHFSFDNASQKAETKRTQGTTFTIRELPALSFYTEKGMYFIVGINDNKERPFARFRPFNTLSEFVHHLEMCNYNNKYPQYIMVHYPLNLSSLEYVDYATKFHTNKSEFIYGDLCFNEEDDKIELVHLRHTLNQINNIIKKEQSIRGKRAQLFGLLNEITNNSLLPTKTELEYPKMLEMYKEKYYIPYTRNKQKYRLPISEKNLDKLY